MAKTRRTASLVQNLTTVAKGPFGYTQGAAPRNAGAGVQGPESKGLSMLKKRPPRPWSCYAIAFLMGIMFLLGLIMAAPGNDVSMQIMGGLLAILSGAFIASAWGMGVCRDGDFLIIQNLWWQREKIPCHGLTVDIESDVMSTFPLPVKIPVLVKSSGERQELRQYAIYSFVDPLVHYTDRIKGHIEALLSE